MTNPARHLEAALRAFVELEYREYLAECGCPEDQIEAEVKAFFAKAKAAAFVQNNQASGEE
jgi:hypothetical protein